MSRQFCTMDNFGPVSNTCFSRFSASVLLDITDEQESFLRKV